MCDQNPCSFGPKFSSWLFGADETGMVYSFFYIMRMIRYKPLKRTGLTDQQALLTVIIMTGDTNHIVLKNLTQIKFL